MSLTVHFFSPMTEILVSIIINLQNLILACPYLKATLKYHMNIKKKHLTILKSLKIKNQLNKNKPNRTNLCQI